MIHFRPICSNDFILLLDWLQRPHVKKWWDEGDDTIDKVTAHYSSDTKNTKRFIVEFDGEDAGYFQYYRFDYRHIGADQFLADRDGLSKGIGTRCLLAFIDLIIANEGPEIISVDPHPENQRAIRCYEKCGFVHDASRSASTTYFMIKHCYPPVAKARK